MNKASTFPGDVWKLAEERVIEAFSWVDRVEAKLRYGSPPIPATVLPEGQGFRLRLDEPAYGVARGQAAVLYEDGAVVGSGLITSAD